MRTITEERLDDETVEGLFTQMCELMYVDLAEVAFDLQHAEAGVQAHTKTTIDKIKWHIATSRLTLEEGKLCYRLIKPVRHLQNETQTVRFDGESLDVETILKVQASKNSSETGRNKELFALIFGLSPFMVDRFISKDFGNLSGIIGFFMSA